MSTHSAIETQTVSAANGVDYANRSVGSGPDAGAPGAAAALPRQSGHWDPALIDALAQGCRVITFDNTGVGATSGRTPNTVAAMAGDAIEFIDALGLDRVDLLGFSIGSFVAPEITLHHGRLRLTLCNGFFAPKPAARQIATPPTADRRPCDPLIVPIDQPAHGCS